MLVSRTNCKSIRYVRCVTHFCFPTKLIFFFTFSWVNNFKRCTRNTTVPCCQNCIRNSLVRSKGFVIYFNLLTNLFTFTYIPSKWTPDDGWFIKSTFIYNPHLHVPSSPSNYNPSTRSIFSVFCLFYNHYGNLITLYGCCDDVSITLVKVDSSWRIYVYVWCTFNVCCTRWNAKGSHKISFCKGGRIVSRSCR